MNVTECRIQSKIAGPEVLLLLFAAYFFLLLPGLPGTDAHSDRFAKGWTVRQDGRAR